MFIVIAPEEPDSEELQQLKALGMSGQDIQVITAGVFTSTAEMRWVGVSPLAIGEKFNLRSWDSPRDGTQGWVQFQPFKAHSRNLVAMRVARQ